MKREDEELCKSIFDTYLVALFSWEEIHWEDGPDPPDFFLDLGDRRFAVEVTTLREKVQARSPQRVSILTVDMSYKNLIEDIKSTAEQGGYLDGGYMIIFSDSSIKITKKLKDRLLEYIRTTQALPDAPEVVVCEDKFGRPLCTIVKGHDRSNEIVRLGPYGAVRVDGIPRAICHEMEEILSNKGHLLRKVAQPKILLVRDLLYGFDQYSLRNPNIRNSCASSLGATLDAFHAVFVIEGDRQGFTFHPDESKWGRDLFTDVLA